MYFFSDVLDLNFAAAEDKYVVFVSGLSIGSSTFNPLQFQLLVDHITGHLGDENVCSTYVLYIFLKSVYGITYEILYNRNKPLHLK